MTFFGLNFPVCLEPMLTTGNLKDAASTIPLELFQSLILLFS